MLPCNSTFSQCTVVSHKRNAERNIIEHTHDNPILDTCLYVIEFANGNVTDLTANTFFKTMYAQCDPDRNEHALLDELIDVMHTDNIFSMTTNRSQSIVQPISIV